MTQTTPGGAADDADDAQSPVSTGARANGWAGGWSSGWSRAAAVVAGVHVVLLLGVAGFYGLELSRGEGSSTANVALSLGLVLAFALLLALLARVWWTGSTRAVVPTVVWNALLVPVVIALFGAEDRLVATALLALVLAGLVTAVTAARRSRRAATP